MSAHRFRALTRNPTRFSLQRLASSAASPGRSPKFFTDDVEVGSAVYRHALKLQRPTTIKWTTQLVNSVSLIGLVDYPLRIIKSKTGRLGAYTLLSVEASRDSNATFRILMEMWDEMAEMCLKHLEPNDFVYVSGRLWSYKKDLKTCYKVIANELNYIDQGFQGPNRHKVEGSQAGAGGAGLEVDKNRLYLWQVFFTNPYEWWDNRKHKVNSWQPDFRHRHTGETLWLSPNDPPWIKRQLQLLDTQMATQSQGDCVGSRSRSRVSMWVYDD
ncbi:protein OSB1, mitochondrial-like [Alnus glutinosa]|uniref:protein OSB1, mitochondrial-like n=1 Tax=Alnus glutinosa TaxID=3517 RepID=UPI002D77A038|nr:protein OSB1, mitochondrial-like [Alnus glutinosa]